MTDTAGPDDPAVAARLYVLLAGVDSLEAFLDELAGLAADEVDRGLSCGISVWLADGPMSVASSDNLAEQLDEVQYSAGDGPSLDAIATGQLVEVHDLDEGERWSAWRARGRDNGVRKSLFVPLTAGDTTLGALNTYSTSAEPFTDADREATTRFATKAARVLAVATRLSEHAELASHLEGTLKARGLIDRATGILMAQQHCSADEAEVLLKTSAQRHGVSVLDAAADIVRKTIRPRSPGPD